MTTKKLGPSYAEKQLLREREYETNQVNFLTVSIMIIPYYDMTTMLKFSLAFHYSPRTSCYYIYNLNRTRTRTLCKQNPTSKQGENVPSWEEKTGMFLIDPDYEAY
jgi:hypothetical protein